MINTPQHLIPSEPLTGHVNVTVLAHLGRANVTVTAEPGFLGSGSAGGFTVGVGGWQHILGLALAATISALVVAILLVASRLASRGPRLPSATTPRGAAGGWGGPGYVYEGLKAELRRAYVRMISRLKRLGVRVPPGAAPLEVAEEAEGRGYGWASRLARLYRDHMYTPREPPRGVVDEASKLAGEV
jgi:hypothetical protein